MKAKRTGFQAVPYFSGTSFMFQGATKDAVIADCLEVQHVSRQSDALSARTQAGNWRRTSPFWSLANSGTA